MYLLIKNAHSQLQSAAQFDGRREGVRERARPSPKAARAPVAVTSAASKGRVKLTMQRGGEEASGNPRASALPDPAPGQVWLTCLGWAGHLSAFASWGGFSCCNQGAPSPDSHRLRCQRGRVSIHVTGRWVFLASPTSSIWRSIEGPRFLPPHVAPLVPVALFLSIFRGRKGGGRAWRRQKLLLKSLGLEVVPAASAHTALPRA